MLLKYIIFVLFFSAINATSDDEPVLADERQIVLNGGGFFNNTAGMMTGILGLGLGLALLAAGLTLASSLFTAPAFLGRSDDTWFKQIDL